MSVLLETSAGDLVIDLYVDEAPKCCTNFLKLCKVKYYNFCPFYNIQKGTSVQSGDPLYPKGYGGSSIWGITNEEDSRLSDANAPNRAFIPEFNKKLSHSKRGTVSMVTTDVSNVKVATSQFIITLNDNIEHLDSRTAVFGQIVEGFDTLDKINESFVDDSGRPLKDIRITHSYVLEDPFPDPNGITFKYDVNSESDQDNQGLKSPSPNRIQLDTVRIGYDENIEAELQLDEEQMEKERKEKEAKAQALTLELIGDLPSADISPPENVLFVCKLNPVTNQDDLELIFSRFGPILSCEIIKDKDTGDSLQYAFIEFQNKEDCERAYMKMQDVLIDDRRIHVDFSQSVSQISKKWRENAAIKRSNKYNDKSSQRNHKEYSHPARRRRYRERSRSPSPRRYSRSSRSPSPRRYNKQSRSPSPRRYNRSSRSPSPRRYNRSSRSPSPRRYNKQSRSPSPRRYKDYSRSPSPTYKPSRFSSRNSRSRDSSDYHKKYNSRNRDSSDYHKKYNSRSRD